MDVIFKELLKELLASPFYWFLIIVIIIGIVVTLLRVKTVKGKANNMICPRCGGQLVNRNGKYGDFIGCSNYPKCKFTRK